MSDRERLEGETMRTTYHCKGCGEDVTAGMNYSGAHHWQRSDGDWDTCGPVERINEPTTPEDDDE